MRMTVHVEGLKELEEALFALGDESTVAGRRALRATSNGLRNALIEAAPHSGRASTRKYWRLKSGEVGSADYGHLRDNIRVTEQKVRKDHSIIMRVHTGDAFWANFLEFGTRNMAARPWMRPVFDRLRATMLSELKANLGRQIELAAKRNARKARKAKAKG